jgi:hypothetical protein
VIVYLMCLEYIFITFIQLECVISDLLHYRHYKIPYFIVDVLQ